MASVCSYRVFPEVSLGVVWLEGSVTASAVTGCMAGLFTDMAWQPNFDALWDARRVRELIIMPNDAKEITGQMAALSERRGTGKRAVIVRRQLEHDMALLFTRSGKAAGINTCICWTMEDAMEWLGIAHPPDALFDDNPDAGGMI